MIIKKSSLFLIFLICAIGSWLFYVKYGVMQIEDRIKLVKREIIYEKRNRNILKAEWKTLTTPERIQRLTEKYLTISQIDPAQLQEYNSNIFHAEHKKTTKKLSKLISKIIMQKEKDEQENE